MDEVTAPRQGLVVTPLDIARRFLGLREVHGTGANPFIQSMLSVARFKGGMNSLGLPLGGRPEDDSTPWCGAFVGFVTWLLERPTTDIPLRARAWLKVGEWVPLADAVPGFDIVILSRGAGPQPGADVEDAAGHVGFYTGQVGWRGTTPPQVFVVGGNQGDAVTTDSFPASRVLGVRRL